MICKEFPAIGEHFYEEKLENGLLVRVIERPGFAKKLAFAAVDYGANDLRFTFEGKKYDTPAGVAHYLEHKMFDLPDGNAMQLFARFGGSDNAFTTSSMTAYFVECTELFEENLSVLLKLVTTPYFTQESVEKERGIIAQEIRMYDDNADSAVQEQLMAAVYRNHPCRVPVAGTTESIEGISAETLHDCFRAFYALSNMMICVIGDVQAEAVIEQIRRETPAGYVEPPVRDYGAPEEMTCAQDYTEKTMEVSRPTFAIGFKCDLPESGAAGMREECRALLAAEILIGESAPLYTTLYAEGLIDGDFSMDYEFLRGAATLIASGDSDDPRQVMERLIAEAQRLGTEGVDEKLLSRLKKSTLGRKLRELDSFDSICFRMCSYHFDGAEYFDYPTVYESVTKDDVEQFLRDFVKKERAALSVILPGKENAQ